MKKKLGVLLAIAVVGMFASSVNADQWLDEVISWNDVEPLDPQGDPPEVVLGPTGEGTHLTLSTDDELVVKFSDNYAFDGEGDDIRLYEHYDSADEIIEVYVSRDNQEYVQLADAVNDARYDLAGTDVNEVRYLRLVGKGLGGSAQGYDLTAIEALNSTEVPQCAGGPATTMGVKRVYAGSDLVRHLIYCLLPIGIVVALRIWYKGK